jgi:hypothetical protein
MKTLTILLIFACNLIHAACDTKGVGAWITLNVPAGTTHTETFDFTDCQVGLRNSHFYLEWKGKGITAELLDLTTEVSYGAGVETRNGAIVWYCVNNCESLKGHVLQLVIRNEARKAITVEVQRSVCYCGP